MQLQILKCDNCGEEVAQERCSGLVIFVATEVLPAKTPPHPAGMMAFALGPEGIKPVGRPKPEPQRETFELCPTCAMAMMITLKQSRLKVKLGHNQAVRA